MVGVQCHRDYHEQVDLSGLLSAFQILKSPLFRLLSNGFHFLNFVLFCFWMWFDLQIGNCSMGWLNFVVIFFFSLCFHLQILDFQRVCLILLKNWFWVWNFSFLFLNQCFFPSIIVLIFLFYSILFLSLHSETAVNHNRDTATVDGVLAINNV